MEDNSSVCELTGYDIDTLSKDKLYGISKKLFGEKARKINDLRSFLLFNISKIFNKYQSLGDQFGHELHRVDLFKL